MGTLRGFLGIFAGVAGSMLCLVCFAAHAEAPFGEGSLVRQKCAACHQPDQEGRLEVIEETRMSPEEWKVVVDRMGRMSEVPMTEGEFKVIVKELSKALCLAPAEMCGVAYLNSDENSQYREIPKDDVERRMHTACVRCHTFGKIVSHRCTRSQWNEVRSMHLGYYPTVIGQMREMDWAKESTEMFEQLSKRYPFEDPAWPEWMKSRKDQDLSGIWNVAGFQPGKGYYEGSYKIAVAPGGKEDEYIIEKEVFYEDGESRTLKGEGTLYSEYHLRYALSSGGQAEAVEGVFDLNVEKQECAGKWWKVVQATNEYGDESFAKVDGSARLYAVFPNALGKTAAGPQKLVLLGVRFPETVAVADIECSEAGVSVQKVERVSERKVICELAVGKETKAGVVTLGMKNLGGKASFTVFDQVDGMRIYPAIGRARVSCGDAYPPQGVQFVARGIDFGPDRRANTADDLVLEPLSVRWWLEEEKTGEKDDDLKYLETAMPNGCYVPFTTYAPIEERYQRREGTGLIAVLAACSEGGKELKDRALLVVTEPDFIPHLK